MVKAVVGWQIVLGEAFNVMELVKKFVDIDSLYEFALLVFGLSLITFGVLRVTGSFASGIAKKLRLNDALIGIMIIAAVPIVYEWVKPAFKALSN